MELKLEGKKALVTGSTAGIGFATARALAAEGAEVVVNGRTQERVDAAISRIRRAHAEAKVSGIASDVSNAAGCAKVARALGEVDILVNNMGIFEPKPFEKIPDEDWLHIFEANVMSGVRLSRHYLAGMREKNWGRIVFVSSESAVQIPAEMVHYGMSKTAQVGGGARDRGERGGDRNHREQRAGRPNAVGGSGDVHRADGRQGRRGGVRGGIFQDGAAEFAAEEIRDD